MSQVIEAEDFSQLYPLVLRHLLSHGTPTSPRGLPTSEARGCTLHLSRPRSRVLNVAGRVPNPAFAVAEAAWILSGSDAGWIFDYNEGLRRYADRGVLRGAYGPRIRHWNGHLDQLDCARRLLLQDPQSRRAVIQIFDPGRDWAPARDVPCTIGHRFLIRDERLHQHTTMRSQDAWLGLPYDIFTNTVLQELMAGWIGVEVGDYTHTMDSLHLYDTDAPGALGVLESTRSPTQLADDLDPSLEVPFDSLDLVLAAARDGDGHPLPGGWASFAAVLASYRHWKAGDRKRARELGEGVEGPLAGALSRWYDHLADPARTAPAALGIDG